MEMTKVKFNLSVLNKENIEANIDEFLAHFYENRILDPEVKRENYLAALNKLQNNAIPTSKEYITIEENSNHDILHYLSNEKTADLYSHKDNLEIKEKINKALDLLKHLNPNLYTLIYKLVGTIIFSKSGDFSSATTPTHLGIIFLNPNESWEIVDYAESIYHEFIHLSIFLEDMIHNLFNSNEVQVKSVIRGVHRPLDKSFHAAIVSIGIMHLYYMTGDVKKQFQYMGELNDAVNELTQVDTYLDNKGKELLENMKLFSNTKDFEGINHCLGNE
ncbi:HEXXH motif-containing putative peptide modification protein [Virgibacillus sp. YIM 98842]|uniref:aKG-HExxH-type peptide beta-hydroxylase n=1 Tax=Virgibacillus sp. YIM 98842 TaxID=2663533 RepID=UPI0013DB2C1C|nr:HEXXH motif-containing putative peptide modification protein [Virgibacillus sp. YIM 98842]